MSLKKSPCSIQNLPLNNFEDMVFPVCVCMYTCVYTSPCFYEQWIFLIDFIINRTDGLPGHLPFGGFLGRAWESGTRPREAGHRGTAEWGANMPFARLWVSFGLSHLSVGRGRPLSVSRRWWDSPVVVSESPKKSREWFWVLLPPPPSAPPPPPPKRGSPALILL